MYFKISKKNFYAGLSTVARAISTFSPLPAFSGIKIVANQKSLVLTGSDSDITIQTTIKASEDCVLKIHDMGATVIEAKYILEIVRKIDAEEIEFEMLDGSLSKISSASSEFRINGMLASEYPTIDLMKPKDSFLISEHELKNIILQTSFATSDKEIRPALTGVNFHCEEKTLHCVATDSYRLAKKTILLGEPLNFNITIPAKSLQEVVKTLQEENDVEVAVNDKKAQFIIEDTIVQTRLIDGIYPDTDRLIPLEFEYELTIETNELLRAIDRSSFIKNDGVPVIKFSLGEKECILSSKSIEIGSSTEVLRSASFHGEPIEISCNGHFVFESVRAIGGNLIKFSFSGEMKPFIITSLDDDKILQLVLPVRTYA